MSLKKMGQLLVSEVVKKIRRPTKKQMDEFYNAAENYFKKLVKASIRNKQGDLNKSLDQIMEEIHQERQEREANYG